MVEVITGPMRGGKSKLLIERLQWYVKEGYKVYAFKPSKDTRWSQDYIVSRAGGKFKCSIINDSDLKGFRKHVINIFKAHSKKVSGRTCYDEKVVIAIDEIQFISDKYIIDLVKEINKYAGEVIISGLDYDSEQKPFGFTLSISEFADTLSVVRGKCEHCSDEYSKAKHTIALFDKKESIEVGDQGYLPVCDKCLSLVKVAL